MLKRLEIVPYSNLDQQLEMAIELEKQRKRKEFKNFHDIGNCFLIEHFISNENIRI